MSAKVPKKMSTAPAPTGEQSGAGHGPVWAGWRKWIGLLLIVVATGLAVHAHRETFAYALCGFDTYPQIAGARITSWKEFLDTFREVLTDGSIEAQFYRPVQNLTIALDYGISGLDPRAYHVDSLVVTALCVLMIGLATRRVLGREAWLGPVVAALMFGLHPVLLNFVPTPCRRSELLVILFMMAALWVAPQPGDRRVGWRLLGTGVFTLLASGSKDVGVMALGLLFWHQFLLRWEGGFFRSLWRALLNCLPAFLGAALYLANRTWVLGGLGGYQRADERTYFERTNDYVRLLLGDVFGPYLFFRGEDFMVDWSSADVGILLAVVLLVLALGALVFCAAARTSGRRRAGVLIVIGLAFSLPPFVLLGALRFYGPWYAGLPLVAAGLTMGGLAQLAAELLRARLVERVFGGAYAVAVALLLTVALWASPLWCYYPEWNRASRIVFDALGNLDRALDTAQPGSVVQMGPQPFYRPDRPVHRVELERVATIQVRGIAAYVEMRYPRRNLRVCYSHTPQCWRARADEVLIRVRYHPFNVRD